MGFGFECAVGILFGDTQKTSGTNAGNTITYVEEITFTVDNGAVDVELEDNLGNKLTISNSVLITSQEVKYVFLTMADSGGGIFVTEYANVYTKVGGNWVKTNAVTTNSGFGLLSLDIGANVSTITATNTFDLSVKFRDGYVD